VDEVKELVGGTCTIFQRMNENGDMLWVATNVIAADKSRAIETFIPAQNADGSPIPVVSALVKGQKFLGRAYVYITAYEPAVMAFA
jgi:methyl-accepting chemotaxis protein